MHRRGGGEGKRRARVGQGKTKSGMAAATSCMRTLPARPLQLRFESQGAPPGTGARARLSMWGATQKPPQGEPPPSCFPIEVPRTSGAALHLK